jgi:hypothetical protein
MVYVDFMGRSGLVKQKAFLTKVLGLTHYRGDRYVITRFPDQRQVIGKLSKFLLKVPFFNCMTVYGRSFYSLYNTYIKKLPDLDVNAISHYRLGSAFKRRRIYFTNGFKGKQLSSWWTYNYLPKRHHHYVWYGFSGVSSGSDFDPSESDSEEESFRFNRSWNWTTEDRLR